MADKEKTVKGHIPVSRVGGFCWEGKDYSPGDAITLPENYAKIYGAQGKFAPGDAPKIEVKK